MILRNLNIFAAAVSLLVSASPVIGGALPVYSDSVLTATPLEPGVMVLETADKTTMYLVEGDSTALLIDTGTDCPGLDGIVSRLTDKPLAVVLTHGHFDHAGNIRYFPEIYMHGADTILDVRSLREYPGHIVAVDEGHVFDLGGRSLRVAHTPGHTPGSISLVDYDAGIAFTGDAFGSGALWMQIPSHCSFATLSESCGRMIELMSEYDVDKIYVGHYPYLKRALDVEYLMDVAVAARRIDKGDTAGSAAFGSPDGAMVLRHGAAEIVYLPEESGMETIAAPTVLLKLDDVCCPDGSDAVHPNWNRALEYISTKKIKANFGIIGYSLSEDNPGYFAWLREVAGRGDVEFWNHGYNNRVSLEGPGEFEGDFASQSRALHLTDSLAAVRVGLKLRAWGRHWTDCNEYTDSALASLDGLRLVFGHPENPTCFKGITVPSNLEMEYPVHNPAYREFLLSYLGKWRGLKSFYLQGHPSSWDEARWNEFDKIISRLIADKARFVTIKEYLGLAGDAAE